MSLFHMTLASIEAQELTERAQVFIRALTLGARLRRDDGDGPDGLDDLPTEAALEALRYRAEARRAPAPGLAAAAVRNLERLGAPRRCDDLALAWWAGLPWPPPADLVISRADAVARCAAWGVPERLEDAVASIEDASRDQVRDAGLLELVRARDRATAAERWAVASRIRHPVVRLEALLELACTAADPGDLAATWADEAVDAAALAGSESVPGGTDFALAALLSGVRPRDAESRFAAGLAAIARTTEPWARDRLYRDAWLAAARLGGGFNQALEALLGDRAAIAERPLTLMDAAASLRFVSQLDQLAVALRELEGAARRLAGYPWQQAVVLARLAQHAGRDGARHPALMLDAVAATLRAAPTQASVPQTAPQMVPLLGAAAAQADYARALDLAALVPGGFLRAFYLVAMLEHAPVV